MNFAMYIGSKSEKPRMKCADIYFICICLKLGIKIFLDYFCLTMHGFSVENLRIIFFPIDYLWNILKWREIFSICSVFDLIGKIVHRQLRFMAWYLIQLCMLFRLYEIHILDNCVQIKYWQMDCTSLQTGPLID